jgi:hypothetical protein
VAIQRLQILAPLPVRLTIIWQTQVGRSWTSHGTAIDLTMECSNHSCQWMTAVKNALQKKNYPN